MGGGRVADGPESPPPQPSPAGAGGGSSERRDGPTSADAPAAQAAQGATRGREDARVDAAADLDARTAWERIATLVMEARPALGAVLQHGAPIDVSRERIALAFEPSSFFGRQAESREGQDAIAAAAARVLGVRPRVEVVYSSEAHAEAKTLAQEANERREARVKATRERALGHPLVAEVSQLFDVPRERMTVRVEVE